MKKVFFCILLICTALPLHTEAQDMNKFWIGGNFGYIIKKYDGLNLTTYKVLPEFGYAWSDRWAVGISIGYVHSEESSFASFPLSHDRLITQGIVIAPFVRFSFLQGSLGKLFVDGHISYTNGEVKAGNSMWAYSSYDTHAEEFGLRPGVAFNVNKHIVITGKFGFLGLQFQKINEQEYSSFGFDFDLTQLLIGLNISF